jgi:hypothetical protein
LGHYKGRLQVAPRRKEIVYDFPRIQELESLGLNGTVTRRLEDRLSELADYRKIHGHCNVPRNNSENTKLANGSQQRRLQVAPRRKEIVYNALHPGIGKLRFEWNSHSTAWEDRLSELADYRKIHGHCNVPRNNSENTAG